MDHQTGYYAEVENSIDKGYENIKTNANQSFQSPDKDLDRGSNHDLSSNLASCWKFFEKFKGAHPVTQNICYKVKCKITENGKPCAKEYVYSKQTRTMNDHLFEVHNMPEFKPKKLSVASKQHDINILIA